jgi:hypothetical protein
VNEAKITLKGNQIECLNEKGFATDPLWDKDTPEHNIPPAAQVKGGGGICSISDVGGQKPFPFSSLIFLFLTFCFFYSRKLFIISKQPNKCIRNEKSVEWKFTIFLISIFFCLSPLISHATELQTFRPTGFGRGGYRVQKTDTLWKMDTACQILYSYLYKPLIISDDQGKSAVEIIKHAQLMNFQIGVGLLNKFEADLELPVYINRNVDPLFRNELDLTGIGDLFLGFKYQLIRRTEDSIGLSISPYFLFSTGSPKSMTGSGNQNFGLSFAFDKQFSILTFAVNLGLTRRQDRGFLEDHFSKNFHNKLDSTVEYGALTEIKLVEDHLQFFLEGSGMSEIAGTDKSHLFKIISGFCASLGIFDITIGYAKGLTDSFYIPAHEFFAGIGYYRWPDKGTRFSGETESTK